MSAHPPVDVVILSGFLGSGKTTLLADFLCSQELGDTAVIVNEVGEIGIDVAVLSESVPDDDILMLDNGCVCCSLRSSLVDTVLRLLRMPRSSQSPPLARIVIETSGLSKPGSIVAALRDRDLMDANLRLMVVSTFDSARCNDKTYFCAEAVAQWAASHRVIVTKLDRILAKEARELVSARAKALSPLAQIVDDSDRDVLVRQTFAPFNLDALEQLPEPPLSNEEQTELNIAHADILVLRADAKEPIGWDEFATWVDDLAGLCGDRLLRFKALMNVQGVDQPVLLQSVGTTFSVPTRLRRAPLPNNDSVVILIVRQMTVQDFEQHLPEVPIGMSRFVVPSRRLRRVFDMQSSN